MEYIPSGVQFIDTPGINTPEVSPSLCLLFIVPCGLYYPFLILEEQMKKILAAIMLVVVGTVSAEPIVTDSTSRSYTDSTSNSTTTIKSPPPTAVAPAITTINNDVCATAASGAVQTQILGISMGGTTRDMNCERIKLSKNLYDMGMKVAAVATLCQDDRVFKAMLDAGTPCPIQGKIGEQAKELWVVKGRIKEGDIIQLPEKKKEEPVRESGEK
jgi:hypothetical protein